MKQKIEPENDYIVLIVEDDELLQKALFDAMKAKGIRAIIAPDGADALRKANNQAFDGIVIDMNLPKRMGHQVIEVVRSNGPCINSVIIVLSGSLNKELLGTIARSIQKAFTKPANIETVVETLIDFMRKKARA